MGRLLVVGLRDGRQAKTLSMTDSLLSSNLVQVVLLPLIYLAGTPSWSAMYIRVTGK